MKKLNSLPIRNKKMKPSHRFILFTLTIAMLALAVNLPTSKSVLAAPATQSAEEIIRATLEEANRVLGGGFSWETLYGDGTSIEGYYMSRPPPPGQEYTGILSGPLFFPENLWIRSVEDISCQMLSGGESWIFHGMEGCIDGGTAGITVAMWQPQGGLEINGHSIVLSTFSIGEEQGTMGAIFLAEALHQAAINNGLYGSNGEENLGLEEEYLPTNPSEINPGQSEFSTDTGEPDEIPLIVTLGSLGIPLAGAIAGTILSTILSGLSTASASTAAAGASAAPATSASPKIGNVNPDGLYWSERPWDQAGPGFVPKDEYERTSDFLKKGYKWENGGWKTPEQTLETEQFERKDRETVAKENAAQRAKMEEERKAPKEKKPEPTKEDPDLLKDINMFDLKDDLDIINEQLKKDKVYVLNPYQGDPTVLFHKLNTVKNMVWDNTAAHLTGSQGLTCEGYVRKTHRQIIEVVNKRFPGSKVEQFVLEEKSSVNPDGVLDWFDSLIVDNHILTKVTLPDGSEWAVDFHQKNAGNSPLMRPWSETRKAWKDNYMGDEYMEGLNELK